LVHYAPSHALEVIVQHLYAKEPTFASWLKRYDLSMNDEGSFHDALYDTKNSLAVYMFFMEYIHGLVKQYPNLATILKLDLEYFSKIFLFFFCV